MSSEACVPDASGERGAAISKVPSRTPSSEAASRHRVSFRATLLCNSYCAACLGPAFVERRGFRDLVCEVLQLRVPADDEAVLLVCTSTTLQTRHIVVQAKQPAHRLVHLRALADSVWIIDTAAAATSGMMTWSGGRCNAAVQQSSVQADICACLMRALASQT